MSRFDALRRFGFLWAPVLVAGALSGIMANVVLGPLPAITMAAFAPLSITAALLIFGFDS